MLYWYECHLLYVSFYMSHLWNDAWIMSHKNNGEPVPSRKSIWAHAVFLAENNWLFSRSWGQTWIDASINNFWVSKLATKMSCIVTDNHNGWPIWSMSNLFAPKILISKKLCFYQGYFSINDHSSRSKKASYERKWRVFDRFIP